MEDHTSPSTNLPVASSSREKAPANNKKDVIYIERNRREKMSEFYTMLQSMVPNLFPKATRATILDETMAYIKGLKEVIETLDAEKAAREEGSRRSVELRTTQRSSSVDVTVSGNAAFFGVCFGSRPRRPLTKVLEVFEKHEAEVLFTTVSCHDGNAAITVTATALEEEAVERIKGDLMII